jgi:hypothetical protein
MAIIVGMKPSIRGSGMLANGATAPKAAKEMTMTAYANRRCHGVAGDVAIEYSSDRSGKPASTSALEN